MSTPEIRSRAMAEAVREMVEELFAERMADAEKAAIAALDDGDKPAKACIRFSVTWPAGQRAPEIIVEASYGKPIKATLDRVVDPEQLKLPLEDTSG